MGQTPAHRRPQTSRSGLPNGPPATRDPFWTLVATACQLQAPRGCPWDRAQTVRSLLPHLIEETWEVFESVQAHRHKELEEELGDVLYSVIFLSLLAAREGWFDLYSLLGRLQKKMVRRHPHVFGRQTARNPEEAYRHWQASKRRERKQRPATSPELRTLLVTCWEYLRTTPEGPTRLRRALDEWRNTGKAARAAQVSLRRASAKAARRSGQ